MSPPQVTAKTPTASTAPVIAGLSPERAAKRERGGVRLRHVAYSERGRDEQNAKNLRRLFKAQPALHIEERAAHPLAVFVATAVLYAEDVFAARAHHADYRAYYHPKDRARAARGNSRRHADYISRAHARGERGGERLSLRYRALARAAALLAEYAAERRLHPGADVRQLKKSRPHA